MGAQASEPMAIRRWHWGKIVILWAWGAAITGPLLFRFLTQPVQNDPLVSTIGFFGSLAILIALSVVTWRWLGNQDESPPPK